MTAVRISEMRYPVTALGPGRRLGLWVQGCSLACPGCMSRHTWDPGGGRESSVDELVEHWRAALLDGADGLTVSGGEPLEQPAIGPLLMRCAALRDEVRAEADILLYTGYAPGAAEQRAPEALAAADAVITGRFLANRPTRLVWRGSANQQLLPRTPLGTARYADHVDREPDRAPIQVGVDRNGVWLVGVPRAGDLARLAAATGHRGVGGGGTTWDDAEKGTP